MKSPRAGVALLLFVLWGCAKEKPAPFGSLHGKGDEWAGACSKPLEIGSVLKEPDPLMATARASSITVPFRAATTQTICAPPGGWALYTDTDERIVGVCVDDFFPPLKNGVREGKLENELERAKPLLAKHFGEKLATDLTAGLCTLVPERIPPGLLRWEQQQPRVRRPDGSLTYPPPIGTVKTCCWEVVDP